MSAHALHQRMSEEDIRSIIPSPHSDRVASSTTFTQFESVKGSRDSVSRTDTLPRHYMQQTAGVNSTPHIARLHQTAPMESTPAYFSSSHPPTSGVDASSHSTDFDDTRRMSESGGMQEKAYFQQTPQQQMRSSTPTSAYSTVASASRLQSSPSPTASAVLTPMPSVTALFDNYRAKQAALDRTHGAPVRAGNIHASSSVTTTSSLTQRVYSSQSTRTSPSGKDSNGVLATPWMRSNNQSINLTQRRPSSAAPATRQQQSSESDLASHQSPRRASLSIDRPIQFQSVQSPNHAIHALTSATQPQPEKSYSDSLYINQLLQEKDAQISASVAKESQLSGQVARLTSEVESLKVLMAQSNEQHNRDTANQLASHSAALQTLQQSHFQELQSLQQRNASALAGREAQLNAIEDARQQSAAAAAAALEQDRQRLKHELVSERDRFQHDLEVDRQRMIAELAATEAALQAEKETFQGEQERIVQEREEAFALRDKALHEKEHNLSELVAESQRVCEQKEQELSDTFQQREQQSLEELQRREEALQQHFQLKEQELYESLHTKELELLDGAAEREGQFHQKREKFEADEHEFYAQLQSKRQNLQKEYEENERSLFDKYKALEHSLQQSFQEKVDILEADRKSILDSYVERQKQIDAGNESKLRAIVNQYKERVKELEKSMEEAAIGNMKANDSAILAATESNRQRVEFEGVINSYKVLVEEQGQQMQLLRKENEALSSELSSIKVTYELLIGRLGDAQTIKNQMLAAEGETARYDASIKEQALHTAHDELDQMRSQLLTLQSSHSSLQIDHARLLAALTVAADSKALAESETERMKMESKRVAKEMERLEKIVYGHSNTNRIATSAAASAVNYAAAPSAGKKGSLHSTTSSKSTRTVTVTSTTTANPAAAAAAMNSTPFMPQSLPYVPSVPSASIHSSSVGAIAGSPLASSSSSVHHLASSPTVQQSFLHSSSNEPLDVNFASALAHGSTPSSGPISRNHLQ